jgi:hypothetical protein
MSGVSRAGPVWVGGGRTVVGHGVVRTVARGPESSEWVILDEFLLDLGVTISPSPQSKDEENEKLHKLREYARDFRRQHTTDAEQFDWDSDDGDYGLAIGRLVVT